MPTILVIEDTNALREEIIEVLLCEGFDVVGAPDGLSGVKIAQENLPDLIICDIMMPILDGYGALEVLRKEHSTAAIPFIFLTAKANKSDMRQAMDSGADDYLTKPFTTSELLAAITARLQKQSTLNDRVKTELDTLRKSISLALPHELRTPLNGIIGFSELLIDVLQLEDQPDLLSMAQNIYSSGKLLHRVIQNFLLYAELEIATINQDRSQLVDRNQTTHVSDAVTETIWQKADQFDRRQDLQLLLENQAVRISKTKLCKIVEEIVDNCFKYSKPNTSVSITSSSDRQNLTILFTDQGRGMSAKQIKQIGAYIQFERKIHEQQGTGLGLTIAIRLAELHGGKITIESIPSQYTSVHLSLPLSLES